MQRKMQENMQTALYAEKIRRFLSDTLYKLIDTGDIEGLIEALKQYIKQKSSSWYSEFL